SGRNSIHGLAKSCDHLHHGLRAKYVDADFPAGRKRLLPKVRTPSYQKVLLCARECALRHVGWQIEGIIAMPGAPTESSTCATASCMCVMETSSACSAEDFRRTR